MGGCPPACIANLNHLLLYPPVDICQNHRLLSAVWYPPSRPFLLPSIFANTIASYLDICRRTRHHPHVAMERHVAPSLIVFHWNLAFDDHRFGTVCYGLKVAVCPNARSDDLIILIRPILASLFPDPFPDSSGVFPHRINRLDEIFYATAVSQCSHHPQFIVSTVFEEIIIFILRQR